MRFDVLTIFPGMFASVLGESVIGRAVKSGLIELGLVDIRDFSLDKHKKTDDYPYGGGSGMVMTAQPIYDAWRSVARQDGRAYGRPDSSMGGKPDDEPGGGPDGKPDSSMGGKPDDEPGGKQGSYTVYLSPQGSPLTQAKALELSRRPHLILLCGHYEGVDERVLDIVADEEISIGDYVLTGGEIPAMALIDCVSRLIPGVLSGEQAYRGESHFDGLLEYPQYTRPASFKEKNVPEVLLSGNHADIDLWRKNMSIERTRRKRPDLLASYPRRLVIGNTDNFRDLGGYPAMSGTITRWRTFFRSDLPKDFSDRDSATLEDLDLTTVIDMRGRTEIERSPSAFKTADWVDYHTVPLLPEATIEKSIFDAPFKELYIAFADKGIKKIGKVFKLIAKSRGAVLFHCHAGKDRTGIIAALLLMIAGVSKWDVVADYEVSSIYLRKETYEQYDSSEISYWDHFLSKPENILHFINHIEGKYGGANAYLVEAGVTGEEIDAILDRFLSQARTRAPVDERTAGERAADERASIGKAEIDRQEGGVRAAQRKPSPGG